MLYTLYTLPELPTLPMHYQLPTLPTHYQLPTWSILLCSYPAYLYHQLLTLPTLPDTYIASYSYLTYCNITMQLPTLPTVTLPCSYNYLYTLYLHYQLRTLPKLPELHTYNTSYRPYLHYQLPTLSFYLIVTICKPLFSPNYEVCPISTVKFFFKSYNKKHCGKCTILVAT